MAVRTPLVLVSGQMQQLQAGDSIPGSTPAYRSTAISTTATTADMIIGCTAAPVTITLMAAATAGAGFTLVIKDQGGNATGANAITIDASGAELIDGALTKDIKSQYGSVSIYCTGTAWGAY